MAIGIVNAEIPDTFIASSGGLVKVESDVETVIRRKHDIVR